MDFAATARFWDTIYSTSEYSRSIEPLKDVLNRALAYFGDIRGKTLLDFGCGMGATSAFFASKGANVIAADISSTAIKYLQEQRLPNITPVLIDRPFFGDIERFELIFGSMILHHIEPFAVFAEELASRLTGKGFFFENNARSKVLIWCRQHLVGRFWIPKYGDPYEFPLTPGEVDELRRHFTVSIDYPEMRFFRLASSYLLKRRFRDAAIAMENFLFRHGLLVEHSYVQCLRLSLPDPNPDIHAG